MGDIIQFGGAFNKYAMMAAMKPDEKVVCTNATVVMDSRGNLSYFDNEVPVCIIEKNSESM